MIKSNTNILKDKIYKLLADLITKIMVQIHVQRLDMKNKKTQR